MSLYLSGATCSAFAHVGGFAAEQAVVARGCEEIDHLGVVAEPGLVLRTSRNDHEVALAADPLFGAKAELHSVEDPHDLLICVTMRLDMDATRWRGSRREARRRTWSARKPAIQPCWLKFRRATFWAQCDGTR